jgi:hypothetical protein
LTDFAFTFADSRKEALTPLDRLGFRVHLHDGVAVDEPVLVDLSFSRITLGLFSMELDEWMTTSTKYDAATPLERATSGGWTSAALP